MLYMLERKKISFISSAHFKLDGTCASYNLLMTKENNFISRIKNAGVFFNKDLSWTLNALLSSYSQGKIQEAMHIK